MKKLAILATFALLAGCTGFGETVQEGDAVIIEYTLSGNGHSFAMQTDVIVLGEGNSGFPALEGALDGQGVKQGVDVTVDAAIVVAQPPALEPQVSQMIVPMETVLSALQVDESVIQVGYTTIVGEGDVQLTVTQIEDQMDPESGQTLTAVTFDQQFLTADGTIRAENPGFGLIEVQEVRDGMVYTILEPLPGSVIQLPENGPFTIESVPLPAGMYRVLGGDPSTFVMQSLAPGATTTSWTVSGHVIDYFSATQSTDPYMRPDPENDHYGARITPYRE